MLHSVQERFTVSGQHDIYVICAKFTMIWRMTSYWMQNMIKEMTEEMSIDDIPVEYGGKLDNVYNATAEKEFRAFVEKQAS